MKKISLFLLTLFAGAQYNLQAAFGGGLDAAFKRQLAQALAESEAEEARQKETREAEEAELAFALAESEAEKEARQKEEEELALAIAESMQDQQPNQNFTEEASQAALANQVAQVAQERAETIQILGRHGAYKEGRGAAPPVAPKPRVVSEELPPPPAEWLVNSAAAAAPPVESSKEDRAENLIEHVKNGLTQEKKQDFNDGIKYFPGYPNKLYFCLQHANEYLKESIRKLMEEF